MGKLRSSRDFWVNQIGHNYDRIKSSAWYLACIALRGAMEVDLHLQGRGEDFTHVKELAGILGEYKLKDTDNAFNAQEFPYIALWHAVKEKLVVEDNSTRIINRYSELALEMSLLRAELEDVSHSTRLAELRSELLNLHNQFSNECYRERHTLGLAA